MDFNTGAFNTSPFNVVVESSLSYTGLKLLKCANWTEGPTHGGIETANEVDVCWDYISEYENLNGATDYRKCFINNYGGASTGSCIIRPSLVVPNSIVGRINISIAIGSPSDTMSTKPTDGSFGSSISTEIEPAESVPVWLKRVITSGGTVSYLGCTFVMTVSES
jgi:hypothetical protein